MVGRYVIMTVWPYTTGTIKAVRFRDGEIGVLFQQDCRFARRIPEVWLCESEVHECTPPSDQDVAKINQKAKHAS